MTVRIFTGLCALTILFPISVIIRLNIIDILVTKEYTPREFLTYQECFHLKAGVKL